MTPTAKQSQTRPAQSPPAAHLKPRAART